MRTATIQRLIAVLCLVAFGLGQTLVASMAVRCRDAGGASRIELACVRSSAGVCLASCQQAGACERPASAELIAACAFQPCEDEPLVARGAAARVPSKPVSYHVVAMATVMVSPDRMMDLAAPDTQRVLRAPCGWDRPPDALALIRTVILVV